MTIQLALWPDSIPVTSVETLDCPWPLGVWLRAGDGAATTAATTIGRLVAYKRRDDQTVVELTNERGGVEVPISQVLGAVSPNSGQPRTGFPKTCPAGRADPVLAINCQGCEHRKILPRGVWRCDHREYQAAPGVHFCLGCGLELGPYAESRGWKYCGRERCLKGAVG